MKRRSFYCATIFGAGLLVLAGCGSEEPTFRNPLDPVYGSDLPVPDSIVVAVGDQVVRLSWGLPDGETADEYAVFRRTLGSGDSQEKLLTRTAQRTYTDRAVRNDQGYGYRIAAGVDGQFGPRSDEILAQPDLFSIVIEDDDAVVNRRDVLVSIHAVGATAVRFSEVENTFDCPWQPAGQNNATCTLTSGDGVKTLYAVFRLHDGSDTVPVSDAIRLDTYSAIDSVTFDGPSTRSPGESIHFRLAAGEANGTATIDVGDVFLYLPLFDDGSAGDAQANDGVYERTIVIPGSAAAVDAMVIGRFSDEAGNTAIEDIAPKRLTIVQRPQPVELLPANVSRPPDPAAVDLRWTQSQEPRFAAYRIFRSELAPPDSLDELLVNLSSATTVEYSDMDVTEGCRYFYRVYVVNDYGQATGSNTLDAFVANERTPNPVQLYDPEAVTANRITLEWTIAGDRDFASYRIYRSETGCVTETDLSVAEITDLGRTYHDDSGLTENTRYYYRVYTYDQDGLFARSNEVGVTTRNEPPPAVTLDPATGVTGKAATLSWNASGVHDFAAYKLFRDAVPTVTPASRLVIGLDEISATSYRDTTLTSGEDYYYRLFVYDDADDPAATGSNTIRVETH